MSASHEYRCCPHESAIRTSPITMGNAGKGGSTALEQMMSVGGDEPDPVEGSWAEPTVWLPHPVCYLCPTGGSIAV